MGVSAAEGIVLHASCVALADRAVLILGPSGAGKSALALQLMAYGAQLVADDRTRLWRQGDDLRAAAPPVLHGMIEARGIGLLRVVARADARPVLAVDLAREERERLPPQREIMFFDVSLPLLFAVNAPQFPAAILQLLGSGVRE